MLKRSILLAASTGVSQVILALLYVVAARESGPALLGTVVASVAVGTFAAGMLDFGSNNLWVREAVSRRYTKHQLYSKILSKIFIAFVLAICVTGVTLLAEPLIPYAFLGALFFSVSLYQCSLVPLRAAGSGSRLSLVALAERTFAMIVFFTLLATHVPAHIALVISLCIGSAFASVLAFAVAPSEFRFTRILTFVAWPWRGTLSYGLGNTAVSAQMLDAVILSSFAGPTAAGVYGAVSRWTQPLSVFAKAFATMGLPVVINTGSLRRSYKLMRRSWQMLAVAAAACVLVALSSPLLVGFILGPQYRGSAMVLSILAIGTIPALFNQPLLIFLQGLGLDRPSAIVMMSLVAVQLGACAFLSIMWSEVGAAVAFAGFQYALLFSFLILLIKYRNPRSSSEVRRIVSVSKN